MCATGMELKEEADFLKHLAECAECRADWKKFVDECGKMLLRAEDQWD